MATSKQNTPGLPNLKPDDLKDPNLSVVNTNFKTIWGKLISLSGGAGNINLQAPVIAADVQIPSQTTPPTNPNTVLTLGSAQQLFTPQNVRNTVIPNSFPSSNLGSGIGAGGGGGGGFGNFQAVDESNTPLPGSIVEPSNVKMSESLSVNDFGASSTASASSNTTAILAAIAAAQSLGKSVRFPESTYAVTKFNVIPYSTNPLAQGLRLWSDCNNEDSLGPGTTLVCDGTGTSWLKACINVVPPNSGNTGPVLTQPVEGMQIEGIYIAQAPGITTATLDGFWLAVNFNFEVRDCGVIQPPAGAFWKEGILTWQCGFEGKIKNFTADTCHIGICLNGGTLDPLTSYTSLLSVENPGVKNCSTAGISAAFSEFCTIRDGSYLNNAVGFFCNGKENTLYGGYFNGNTADIDMVTAVAPWGPTTTPDQQHFFSCSFGGIVNVKGSFGSALCACNFDSGSSLVIDSGSAATALLQHNSLPSTFTDAGGATYMGSCQVSTVSPVGFPGIQSQLYYHSSASTLYICTVSSDSSATWVAIAGGGGAVTSLNTLTGALTIVGDGLGSNSIGIYTTQVGSAIWIVDEFNTLVPFTLSFYNAQFTDGNIVSRHAGASALNLPQSSLVPGKVYVLINQNTSAGTCTINPFAGDTIGGSATLVLAVGEAVFFQSDSTGNWIILSRYPSSGGGGVTSLAAGTGISVSASTGAVTVSNTGVVSINGLAGTPSVTSTGGGLTVGVVGSSIQLALPGAWTSSVPSLALTGATLSGTATLDSAAFTEIGKSITYRAKFTFTVATGGSAVSVDIDLPLTAFTADQSFACLLNDNTSAVGVSVYGAILKTTSIVSIGVPSLTSGHTYSAWVTGTYQGT